MEEVSIGIGCISMLGIAGFCVIFYAAMNHVDNIESVTSFGLAIGGLIAALVRGNNSGSSGA